MDTIEVFRTSATAIRTNKVRSFLTTLGIVIGVSSVILLVSIGNGLQAYVTKQFQDLGANLLFVAPGKIKISGGGPPRSTTAKFTFEDVRGLRLIGPPIAEAMGMINKTGTVKYLNKTYDITVVGVDGNYAKVRNIKAQKGTFITPQMVERSQRAVVIGPTVVKNIFRDGENPLGKDINIANQKLTVAGVTESKGGGIGGSGDLDSYVYMPVSTAQKIYGDKTPASVIIEVDKPENISQATAAVKKYFARRGLTDDDFTVLEPKEILDQVNSLLGVMTVALSGIAGISLVVGGIGIANIMLVSVTERT
jgi:putative ABC transport system permease protein